MVRVGEITGMTPVTITRNSIGLSHICVLAAFIVFLVALGVAESWVHLGTWQEWIAGGLALFTLAHL